MSATAVAIGLHRPDPERLEQGLVVHDFRTVREHFRSIMDTSDEYVIPEYTPISQQGNAGTCGCNAWCDMLEMLRGLDMVKQGLIPNVDQLSRLFLYWTCRCYLGEQKIDSGIYLRLGARQLQTIGVCPETVWPYDTTKLFTSPGMDAELQASDNRIESFYSLSGDPYLDLLEESVRANHPACFATELGAYFKDPHPDVVIDGPPATSIGGHAMIVTGVRKSSAGRQWQWRNSWGVDWCDKGHVWVTDQYMKATTDRWVGTNMKGLLV